MKIVCISDTHCKHGFIPNLPEADMIICSGDISSRGYPWELENFFTWYESLNYKYKILIAGNHDFGFQDEPSRYREMLKKFPSITYLQDEEIVIEGIKIYGTPWQPTFFNWAFNLDRGKEIREKWDLIPVDTDILVVHGPPVGFGDYVRGKGSVGCHDLLDIILQIEPKLVVFGHIHSGHGLYKNLNTTYINASLLDEDYNIAYEPIIFEI